MVEKSNVYSIGQERMSQLSQMNHHYTSALQLRTIESWDNMMGHVRAMNGLIDDFLGTIDETKHPDIAKEINERFDKITKRKNAERKARMEQFKTDGFWEQRDARLDFDDIKVKAVFDKKEDCWAIAMKYGLTHD